MYFSSFPLLNYPYLQNGVLKRKIVTDIFRRVGFGDRIKNQESFFQYYTIKNGETPEIIADKLYGSTDYHWLVLLFNDIVDPYYEWPFDQVVFDNYMDRDYSGTSLYISTIDESPEMITSGFYVDQTIYKTDGDIDGESKYNLIPNTRAVVYGWNKGHCELIVDQMESVFSPGDLIAGIGLSGENIIAKVNRVKSRRDALHHFEKIVENGGETAQVVLINPLSEVAISNQLNQVIGSTLGTDGQVNLSETFLGVYMGVSGAVQNNNYSVSNEQYEIKQNEIRSRIKLLTPRVAKKLPKNLGELIGA